MVITLFGWFAETLLASFINCVFFQLFPTMCTYNLTWIYRVCRDQLDKKAFQKHDTAREWETRHKNSEKSEDQGTNTTPRWRCWNWIQASFIILSAMNERIFRELKYNSCGLQGQRTKWSLTVEYLRKDHHGQKKSPKCSTRMQYQKWQNDLCSSPRQTIQ